MSKTPRKLLTLFGEFIVEFNLIENHLKEFLGSLVEDELIAHILVSNQSFDFIHKRVNAIFNELIDKKNLKDRWGKIYKKLKPLQDIRNDIAHSTVDINPENKNEFVLFRYNETQILKFSQRAAFYSKSDLIIKIKEMKKLNTQLRDLFHTTYLDYTDSIFVRTPKNSIR